MNRLINNNSIMKPQEIRKQITTLADCIIALRDAQVTHRQIVEAFTGVPQNTEITSPPCPFTDDESSDDLTDDSLMPFGKHAGKPLREVSASYLLWLFSQRPIKSSPALESYIDAKYQYLKEEAKQE